MGCGPVPSDVSFSDYRVIATVFNTDILQLRASFVPDGTEGETPCEGPLSVSWNGGEGPAPSVVIGDGTDSKGTLPRMRHLWLSAELPREARELELSFALGEHRGSAGLAQGQLDALRDEFARERLPIEANDGYDAWFRTHRTPQATLDEQRRVQAGWPERPLFSVIVPLYHTPVDFFVDMADSVLGQTYDRLELVLVNSTPGDAELARKVAEYQERDGRVRVVELERNLGITLNTAAGTDVARGDFVCFFDHDDILEPDVLFSYARALRDDDQIDLMYCDEDKLEGGRYVFPSFKPDFSQLLLETNNYVCHMLTIRRSLLESLPEGSSKYDGAQDHRMTLVASERLRHVHHARGILYHWRVNATSTAGNSQAKPESLEAGRVAIEEHLHAIGVPAHVENVPTMAHCYVTILDEDAPRPKVSLVFMGDSDELARGEELPWPGLEVVCTGRLGSLVERLEAADAACHATDADYVLLMDGSALPGEANLVSKLFVLAMREGVGVAGAKARLADGTKWGGALIPTTSGPRLVDRYFPEGDHQARGYEVFPHEVSALTGQCLMLSASTLRELGGIDARAGAWWSADLCARAREAGLSCVEAPMAAVRVTPRGYARERLCMCPDAAEDAWLMERHPWLYDGDSPYYQHVYDDRGYYGLGR